MDFIHPIHSFPYVKIEKSIDSKLKLKIVTYGYGQFLHLKTPTNYFIISIILLLPKFNSCGETHILGSKLKPQLNTLPTFY